MQGRGTYHTDHIFAFYLKGQSPSFVPLLALFTQPAISYTERGPGGSELHLGKGLVAATAPGSSGRMAGPAG